MHHLYKNKKNINRQNNNLLKEIDLSKQFKCINIYNIMIQPYRLQEDIDLN